MQAELKRFVLVAIILAVSAGLTFALDLTQKKLFTLDESFEFPMQLGSWTGEEIPVSERTLEILESPFVIIRKYTNPQGETVYFSGVFSSRNRKAIHPPEVCLTGGGTSSKKDIVNLKINGTIYPTNRLAILRGEKNEAKEVIFYWYKAGDRIFKNFYAQQLQITLNEIKRKSLKVTDIALLRVSTLQRPGDSEGSAEQRLAVFTKLLFDYLKL